MMIPVTNMDGRNFCISHLHLYSSQCKAHRKLHEERGKLNHKNQWIKFEVFETKISQFEGYELITKISQSMGFELYHSYSILWDSHAS